MNNGIESVPDDDGEVVLETLEVLLKRGIPVATLATAVEKAGVFGWDRYKRFGELDESGKKKALDLLAKQADWETDPLSRTADDPRSPLERSRDDVDGPFGHYGWPSGKVPDFESLNQTYLEEQNRKPTKAKRKAPDEFVAALIKLLVEIAKRDPNLNCSQMPGTKADLRALAIKFEDLDYEPATFETYTKGLIQFNRGSRPSDYYKKLFPKYFK